MDIDDYQKKAHTYREGETLLYPVLGLAEEAGEVAGKFAKAVREEKGVISEERLRLIGLELGDVAWFVAELCTCLGLSLSEVLKINLDKLEDRKARGVINGNGDDR